MRSWQIYLLAFSAITAVCADEPAPNPTEEPLPPPSTEPASPPTTQFPKAPPTAVEVAHISPEKVLVYWKSTDEEAAVEAAEFTITVTPKTGDEKTVSVKGKLFSEVADLVAETEYTILIAYVREGQTDSSDAKTITTLKADFLRPTEAKTEKNGDLSQPNTVTYKTKWVFDKTKAPETFKGYEVLYCTTACEEELKDSGTTSVEKDLYYYTAYSVYVSAVFEDNAEKKTRQTSDAATITTVQGKPGRVENLKIHQEPDALDFDISWQRPNQPNGKIQKYKLQVSADGGSLINQEVTELNFTVVVDKTQENITEQYKIEVTAINEADGDVKNGDPRNTTYALERPAPPSALVLKSATTDTIEIEIQRDSEATLKFEVTATGKEDEVVSEKLVKLDTLKVHQTVEVSVAACIPLDGERNFCGKPKTETFTSNVGAPSAVKNLNVTEANGKYLLRWGKPETPGGPIDGYTVQIVDKTDATKNKNINLGNVNANDIDATDCTEYSFVVVAFNNDVVTKEPRNGAPSEALLYKTGNCPKGFPAWAIVLIVLGIVGAAGGGGYYFVKMRRGS